MTRWRRAGAIALVVGAVAATSCGDASSGAPASLRATGPATTTSEAPTTTIEAPTTTEATTTSIAPATTATTLATAVRPPKPQVPRVTVAPVVSTVLPLPTTSTTNEPALPVPELFDVVQGIGTPCVATEQRPDGCWFFVYATLETRTWTHHVYSDAATTPWVARDHGNNCGDEAQPHHRERGGCSFYFGPVHGRAAGQRECFSATTVSGQRESQPSSPVCFTWTDQAPTSGTGG